MVRRLIILGIDGMDRDVVMRYREQLPNLYPLMQRNGMPRLRSVFPADTTPAWATIYTGLDPSEHGIINFVNMGAKENAYRPMTFDDSAFRGRTFWDALNRRGLSCAVVLPMNIKEGWEIDGVMITRPHEGRIRVHPASRREVYQPDEKLLGTESKFTAATALPALRDEFFAKAEEECRLTLQALAEPVDVLFAYFSTTDGVQHEFWHCCDPSHPRYPGPNAFEHVIRDMYIRMDRLIGEIAARQPDTPMLILSDHGHGARPVSSVRINELLRRGGFLTPGGSASKGRPTAKKRIRQTLKKTAITFVRRVGLPAWAVVLARKFPVWKRLFASSADFDWSRTTAYLSDLSAMKNYSYGGIRLNGDVVDKDATAEQIIAYLKDVRIPGEDKPLFEWIVRANAFYHGQYLDRYPEILFQMDERWGGEWELGEDVFIRQGHENVMSSGGHRWRSAVLAARHIPLDLPQYDMTDIFRLIMEHAQ